tara:strand:- start:1267 stop:1437 length:171 start_codon:yes stop_codon:yes gene_type:complete
MMIHSERSVNMNRYFVEIKRGLQPNVISFYIYAYSKSQIVDMLGDEYFLVTVDQTE